MKRKLAVLLAFVIIFTSCIFVPSYAEVRKYSIRWYQTDDEVWHIVTKDNELIKNTWLLDDECDVEGGLWYLIDSTGDMVSDPLFADEKGHYYSCWQEHDGHFGNIKIPEDQEALKGRSDVRVVEGLSNAKVIRLSALNGNSSEGDSDQVEYFTLSYDLGDVEIATTSNYDAKRMKGGRRIAKPATPSAVEKNNVFLGWFDDFGGRYEFENEEYFISEDTTLYAEWKILVTEINMVESKNIAKGSECSLEFEILPANATSQTLVWSSSDTSKATVNENGVITALEKTGCDPVIITAKATDGSGVSAECSVSIGEEDCVLEGTLITMADGTQKAVENLSADDVLLSYDFHEGKMMPRKLLGCVRSESDADFLIRLKTAKGNELTIVGAEAVFDTDAKTYVDISADNYEDVVGMHIMVNEDGHYGIDEIVETSMSVEAAVFYEVYTETSLNYIANNLVVNYPFYFEFEFYPLDSNIKMDADAYAEIVENVGLYSYDEFSDIMSEEFFEKFGVAKHKYICEKNGIPFEEAYASLIGFEDELKDSIQALKK